MIKRKKTTYIVSGYIRSGTSMMMKALMAGGLNGYYNEKTEARLRRMATPEYKANPNGFYELSGREMNADDFPKKHEGRLIKVLHNGLSKLSIGKYKIVFMLRDPAEIMQSIKKVYGKNCILDPKKYDLWMKESIAYLMNRRDVRVTVLNYSDVVKDPLRSFQKLRKAGFPINPVKAAATVDKTLYRNKKGGVMEWIWKYFPWKKPRI